MKLASRITGWTLTAMLAVGAAGSWTPTDAQQAVRLGTSSVGSTFYVIAVAMSKMIQEHSPVNVTVESLGGSHANMFGLAANKVDLAIANSGAAFDRLHGNAPFKEKFPLRLVAQGQPSYRWILVRRDSGIETPQDLVGKTISAKRRPLPELEKIARALIDVYDLPEDGIQLVSSANLGEVNRALRGGSIHGAVFPFGPKQPVASKLFHDRVVRFLRLPEDKYEAILAKLPKVFYRATIARNSFENQLEPVRVLGLNALLVAAQRVSDDLVYRVTKAIMGRHEEFAKFHAAGRYWNVKRTLAEPKIPFHPGAIRYYKETGLWNAEMDRIQESLL